MIEWLRKRKIAMLPNARRTPDVALAQTLEKAKAGHIKSVYIGIQWSNDTFVADWSSMTRSELASHALIAQSSALNEISQR